MDLQILNLWQKLFECNVKYITIGGYAVNYYAYNRSTGDIDILIADTLQNRKAFRVCLEQLGIGDFEEIETMQFLPGWTDFTLDYGLRLDVLTKMKGIDPNSFDELYTNAETILIHNIEVKFIDYNNLILAKKATGRDKDLNDIAALEKIKKWEDENK